jgi:tetratricopeptide (TPR) repeat protein
MKTVKYLFVGAMMLSFSAPVAAQEAQAAIDAAKEIIKSQAPDMVKQVNAIYKKNKKNAEVVVGIGRAFYEAVPKDTTNARVYANYGIALKSPAAYVLAGDIYALGDAGGDAARMYEQAIYFGRENGGQIDETPYYKYATVYRKVSLPSSIEKLDQLAQDRPDLAANGHVDVLKGRVYDLANKVEEAAKVYNKVPLAQLEERDVVSAARANYLLGDYKKSQEIIEYGLKSQPRKFTFNQLGMFNYTMLKDYDKALEYADRMLNQSDSVKMNPEIYGVYAKALNGAKKYNEAIEVYKKTLQLEFDSQDKKAGVIKDLADAYKGMDDYENAVIYYDQFLKTVSHASLTDYADLGRLYVQYADKLQGEEKQAKLKKADEIYADLAAKNADAKEYSLFWRARVGTMMDPDASQGLAQPFYEELVNTITAKAEMDNADKARLKEGCNFLMVYYLKIKDDTARSKEFAQKVQTVDPANETAKQILELK